MLEFKSWSKIPRIENETWIATEKIDGTNGLIAFDDDMNLHIGSRSKWITSDDDNHGFAKWANENLEDLKKLGPGYHFGEWYGRGIQRNYGLKDRRFALFYLSKNANKPDCCHMIPILGKSPTLDELIADCIFKLDIGGSLAVLEYPRPEGFIIQSTLTGKRYKFIINEGSK